jgi:CubicO group peptidase (beta-lactamase class C family)
VGCDWAGKMIEKVSNQSLESYMQQHIWGPLGMVSTTFRLQSRPDIKGQKAEITKRNPDKSLSPNTSRISLWFPDPDTALEDHGGGGVFSCVSDYFKVLTAIVENNGVLLTPASIDLLFTPCLSTAADQAFEQARSAQAAQSAAADGPGMAIPAPARVNYSVGGMITGEDVPGGRKAGSLSWGGLPNLSWIIDPASRLVLFYASQVIPPGDLESGQIVRRFEAAVYSGEFFS